MYVWHGNSVVNLTKTQKSQEFLPLGGAHRQSIMSGFVP